MKIEKNLVSALLRANERADTTSAAEAWLVFIVPVPTLQVPVPVPVPVPALYLDHKKHSFQKKCYGSGSTEVRN